MISSKVIIFTMILAAVILAVVAGVGNFNPPFTDRQGQGNIAERDILLGISVDRSRIEVPAIDVNRGTVTFGNDEEEAAATIRVSNTRPTALHNLIVEIDADPQSSFAFRLPPYVQTGSKPNQLVWTIGTLEAGEEHSLILNFRVKDTPVETLSFSALLREDERQLAVAESAPIMVVR